MGVKLITTDVAGDYQHWCEGCKCMHQINTERANMNNARWKFDGNMEQPTFTPSVNISWENHKDEVMSRCHYTITAGMVQFHGDCTHEFKDVNRPLLNIPDDY